MRKAVYTDGLQIVEIPATLLVLAVDSKLALKNKVY